MWILKSIFLGVWLFGFGTIAFLWLAVYRHMAPHTAVDLRLIAGLTTQNPWWWASATSTGWRGRNTRSDLYLPQARRTVAGDRPAAPATGVASLARRSAARAAPDVLPRRARWTADGAPVR